MIVLKNGVPVTLTQEQEDAKLADLPENSSKFFNLQMQVLRTKRNALLVETDHYELPSQAPISQAMTDYREALRDLTVGLNTVADIDALVWPTKP